MGERLSVVDCLAARLRLYPNLSNYINIVAKVGNLLPPNWLPSDMGPLVLVADDSDISCEIVVALLARRGLRAEVAPDGLRAWRMAVNKSYAAILMDCEMPQLDGWEATRRIRAAERDLHVPIIAMTGLIAGDNRERCLMAGMNDFLAKPVHSLQLGSAIERWQVSGRPDA
ncbi:MAG: response regulator [Solirubrobacteraceae bacterium]